MKSLLEKHLELIPMLLKRKYKPCDKTCFIILTCQFWILKKFGYFYQKSHLHMGEVHGVGSQKDWKVTVAAIKG